MKIAIIGTGYVGLVTGVSLALLGHKVICVGRNKNKIQKINEGRAPFYEPGLDKLLKKTILEKSLQATDDFRKALLNADIIIIAVGTPTIEGNIDLSAIKIAARQIGEELKHNKKYQVVVVKSTVVPTTTQKIIKPILEEYSGKKIGTFGLCMSPEFLREGNAVEDATNPDRIVIGQFDKRSGQQFAKVYNKVSCPKVIVNLETAEITKYTANSLLATLISFSNEIARVCEKTKGVDVLDVWRGVHLDSRLSPRINNKIITPGIISYLFSGCGYGGSCFPKDTKALAAYAKKIGVKTELINSVIDINQNQPKRMIAILKKTLGNIKNRKISILGLTFKSNSDDLRESPAITIIKLLLEEGARVFCHDPIIIDKNDKEELKGLPIILVKNIEDALRDAHGAFLVTAWEEYKKLAPDIFRKYMKNPIVIDGRRIYSKEIFRQSGITYEGIGLGEAL
ncbi:UDP-glucose/GDP-mannose dehydrogenase family protein [Candidatus Parcubacteria bacterium]|nr:MAG: UDP-glucose/GDP-mannose dehydrogenase family protein [Candidatus Parcubacteria bacterium]